jgi:hypothetical protein
VVLFNYTTMQVTAKIVYYGPGLGGKTSNLQYIHHKTAPKSRGEMVSLETEADRTLFFDLLPIDVGVIGGMKVRLQLYTVPGQVFYNATRKLVLKGVDGVVFVADSQVAMQDANVESLRNLEANLAEQRLGLDRVPLVLQYNKRDLRNILTIDQLNATLNPGGLPYFEAAALHGLGVFETLKAVSRLALANVRQRLASEDPARRPAAAPAPAPAAPAGDPAPLEPPLVLPPPAAAGAAPPSADPLAALLGDAPAGEEIRVEFAEEDTDKHVRVVPTKAGVDIQQELEKLRTLTTGGSGRGPAATTSEVDQRLQEMLVPGRASRQELKRKAAVSVPARFLKNAARLTLHLEFEQDGSEGHQARDVVRVSLAGGKRLERLLLHLDLDVKGD